MVDETTNTYADGNNYCSTNVDGRVYYIIPMKGGKTVKGYIMILCIFL